MQIEPTISVLITTYNRKELFKRALDSVLSQTFTDWEIVVIDDCSTDATHEVIPKDPRIRYYRNEVNQGAEHGDRIHIKRFVNELARGEYFVYLCSDDYWMFDTLLARQIALFNAYPDAAMIIGGQMSDFGTHKEFHKDIYPKPRMRSPEFLEHFSMHPIECNIIIGATLYKKDLFIKSGALKSESGTKWQAGYEVLMAPGCYGDVIYINEPCVMTEITPENASFQRTQLDHYNDSVISLSDAFWQPMIDWKDTPREQFLMDTRKQARHNISQAFLRNAKHIKEHGNLNMCSTLNISRPVTEGDLIHA